MKQQDIAILIIVVFFAGMASFFVSSKVISPAKKQKAYVVTPIDSRFSEPSSAMFNPDAINPAVPVQVGPNNNQQPFANGN